MLASHNAFFEFPRKDLLGALDVVDTLNLDEGGAGTGDVTRALVAQVTSPVEHWSAQNSFSTISFALRVVNSEHRIPKQIGRTRT